MVQTLVIALQPWWPPTGRSLRHTASLILIPPPRTASHLCLGSIISAVALTVGTQRGDHSLVSILHCIVVYHFDDRKNVKLALDPIVHESWKSPKLHSNDIALLKLAESVDLKTYTPACLPKSGTDYTGQKGKVYGKEKLLLKTYPRGIQADRFV